MALGRSLSTASPVALILACEQAAKRLNTLKLDQINALRARWGLNSGANLVKSVKVETMVEFLLPYCRLSNPLNSRIGTGRNCFEISTKRQRAHSPVLSSSLSSSSIPSSLSSTGASSPTSLRLAVDITLAEFSSVPVINALSDKHHPLQALADIMTLQETFGQIKGLNMAWVGDGNNVLHSLMLTLPKLGANVRIAVPKGYEPDGEIMNQAQRLAHEFSSSSSSKAEVILHHDPHLALHNANVIVTDTWISMGQEAEKAKRMRDFAGYQVTEELARRAQADPNWRFMHCLPRKQEEVDDEVFYSKQRSLVFPEAENRKWTVGAVLLDLLAAGDPVLFEDI